MQLVTGYVLFKPATTNQNFTFSPELTLTLVGIFSPAVDSFFSFSEVMILFVLQSSYLEDSESAALLCCECGESEIFSDFNVRRYMFYAHTNNIQPLVIKIFWEVVQLASDVANLFVYLALLSQTV